MGLKHTNRSPNLGQKTKSTKKRESAKFLTLLSRQHRINLKESEKKDKYLDLAKELKKLWNMKVTIVPIVIGLAAALWQVGTTPASQTQTVIYGQF